MTQPTDEQLATVPVPGDEPLVYGSDDTDIVRIYHAGLDTYGESPRAGVKYLNGWEIVDPTPEQAVAVTSYDPSAYSVDEVNAKLDEVSEAEREAIIVLEREGKNRKTIHGVVPVDEA